MRKKQIIYLSCLGVLLCRSTLVASSNTQVKTLFLNGEYNLAISQGEEIINQSLDNASSERDELYYIMGLCYLQEADYLRADDMFEFVINEFPGSRFVPDAKLGIADISYIKGEYSAATDAYRDLLRASFRRDLLPGLYSRFSLSLSNQGEIDEAQEYLLILQREYPESFEGIKGKQLFNQGSFYTVQVGAFSDRNNAIGLKSKLLNQGYSAYVEELTDGGALTHRVRVGRLKSRQEAILLQGRLVSQDYPAKIFP